MEFGKEEKSPTIRGMIWLGTKRGYLTDWVTQRWVQLTGRKVALAENPWLAGPHAPTTGISPEFFETWAAREGLESARNGEAGILPRFSDLLGADFAPDKVSPEVIEFYEGTSRYELDAWAEWCGFFRPFGWLLAVLFSRRLQQLNVPLSALDTSRGMTNEVLPLRDPKTSAVRHTVWFRRLRESGNVLYAGFYSTCRVPGQADPCVKVVFPLPNGNAIVVMRTECCPDGSLIVNSSGKKFGEAGFYFTVDAGDGFVWTRYVRAMQESIHVYAAENGGARADHVLHFFGATFLKIHYRMRREAEASHVGGIQASVE